MQTHSIEATINSFLQAETISLVWFFFGKCNILTQIDVNVRINILNLMLLLTESQMLCSHLEWERMFDRPLPMKNLFKRV